MAEAAEDRMQQARIKSCEAAISRLSRAVTSVSSAVVADLASDDMGKSLLASHLTEATTAINGAVSLIADCRRSIGDEAWHAMTDRNDLIEVIAKLDDHLRREGANMPIGRQASMEAVRDMPDYLRKEVNAANSGTGSGQSPSRLRRV